MKKILQISKYYYPFLGGMEQVARDIVGVLNSDNYKHKIICFNTDVMEAGHQYSGKETVSDTVDGVEVIRCSCVAKVASQSMSISYPGELRRVIKEFEPDIVIFHHPNPFVATFLLPLLNKNIKFILYWHLDITKQKLLKHLFHIQTHSLLKRADSIVATSPNYIEGSPYLSKYKNKCVVVPNAINEKRLAVTPEIIVGAQKLREVYKDKCICLAVGRHVEYKGFEYLIKAAKLLDSSFKILIAGTGPLTESLKAQAADDDKIIFLGRMTEGDLVNCYQACDIFCFPSITKNEAFGIALAEGMYYEKPAVTFTIEGSGVNYVSLHNITGIEVPNRDVTAYAAALKKLSEDSSLKTTYGKNAKKRVEENFLLSNFAINMQNLAK